MKKGRGRRFVFLGAVAALVVGLVAAVLLARQKLEVEVSPVTRGTFERFVEEDGRARVRDRYVITSPVGGTIERTRLHVGDAIALGDVVAVLRPAPGLLLDAKSRGELEERRGAAEAAVERARLGADRAEAARKHADGDLSRVRALAQAGTLPAHDLEHAELEAQLATKEADEARFAVHMAEHQLEMARAALGSAMRVGKGPIERVEIKAPASGRVLRIHQESEGLVASGAPLLEVADQHALEVVVDLLSTDAVQVEPGADVELKGWGGAGVVAGRVRLVEPMAAVKVSALGVEEERVNVIVDPLGETGSWNRIGDGYRVDVRIRVERLEGALRVPTTALFREGGDWCAYAAEDGRAHRRVVRLKSYGPLQSAVEGGLAEGEGIILQPGEAMRDGIRIQTKPSADLRP